MIVPWELVTLDCSLTHVLQPPKTQPYHSWELDELGLYARSLLLINNIMLSSTILCMIKSPCYCFSKSKNCRDVMPENWKSKLNTHTGLTLLYVGPSHSKTMPEITKRRCKTMKILLDPRKNLSFAVKKDVWCSIVERTFFNIKTFVLIARVLRRWLFLIKAQ